MISTNQQEWTYRGRLAALCRAKLAQTAEKQQVVGSMDHDDWALILPPADRRKVVRAVSGSGVEITDVLLEGFEPRPNHANGGFYGPKAVGANFRALLEAHPPCVDSNSSLAGGYMVNFGSYRKAGWNPDIKVPDDLREEIRKYNLVPGIGGGQHFCQDLAIGLRDGWGGILERIRRFRTLNAPRGADFYDGLEDVVLGMQAWISHNAAEARRQAGTPHPTLSQGERSEEKQGGEQPGEQLDGPVRQNLLEMAEMNELLVNDPPRTFRQACQWILWFDMAARMYNGSGSLGRLDVLLTPYYQKESAAGTLGDEEATFHVACLLVRDTAYIQLGGPDADGHDVTNRVSYLVLEATHWLKIPANVGVAVGKHVDPGLLRRGVEIMFEDKTGIPKFLGVEQTAEGFTRLGFPLSLGRQRIYSGCHWLGIPGREYTLNDCVKLTFGPIFDIALREMLGDSSVRPGTGELWARFEKHLRRAVLGIARGLDFQLEHGQHVFPELVMDLLCHGPIEKGRDASGGGVEFYNMCLDGVALGTVADSFAACQQRIEEEKVLSWQELLGHLDHDWGCVAQASRLCSGSTGVSPVSVSGTGGTPVLPGERARLMMRNIPRFGSGGSKADEWAVRISRLFARLVTEKPTPKGYRMVPGLFSWALTAKYGQDLGATPNGRHKGAPVSHGSNPDPGFRKDGAPTALAVAVSAVNCGYGNTCPMQLELDPGFFRKNRDDGGVEVVCQLIRTHFDLGGTQINMNLMDKAKVLEAHADPARYPDLVVRVTGFSAYWASLSKDFRQLVVDRIISEEK